MRFVRKTHLFVFLALVSGVMIWIAAWKSGGSDSAMWALVIEFLVTVVIAFAGQVQKYAHLNKMQLRQLELTKDGVKIEMQEKESELNG